MTKTTFLDRAVVEAVAVLEVPREGPADSFVLHAQLELMARVGLLPYVDSSRRDAAVAMIERLASTYAATGTAVRAPRSVDVASPSVAAAQLAHAISVGDLDEVDALVVWLANNATAAEIRLLVGEVIVDSLAAAGHAPIGLHLMSRVADGAFPATLLRGPLRELARNPDWRIRWFRNAVARVDGDLGASLAAVPHLGRPGSDFIYPLMSQAESSGAASSALESSLVSDPVDAGRVFSRVAAWSMIHDDPSQAPYGWSHCLTMPQAVMSLAGDAVIPSTAIAVAGTFVTGFRAAHGLRRVDSIHDDDTIDGDDIDVAELVTYAALHEDAHLVKYTLACLHAAEDDPQWRGTYLHAATTLANWWRKHDAA